MAIGDPNLPAVIRPPIVNPNASGTSTGALPEPRPALPTPHPSTLRTGILVGLLGAVVVVGGAIGVARWRAKRPPIKVVDPTIKPPLDPHTPERPLKDPSKNPPPRPPHPAPPGMAYIAGATFAMGSTEEEVDGGLALCRKTGVSCRRDLYEREQPQRTVTVSSFAMDRTEVTNEQMVAWLNAQKGLKLKDKRHVLAGKTLLVDLQADGGGIESAGKRGFQVHADAGELPAVLVTWAGAQRYCAAQGKRLPTEAEWELAARGEEQRLFPWGAALPRCASVAFGRGEDLPADRRCTGRANQPTAVGKSIQDRTPDGVMDLGGNVAEWVQDRFEAHYPACVDACKDPVVDEPFAAAADDGKPAKKSKKGDGEPVVRVIRGGAYSLAADACRGAGRSRKAEDLVQPEVGFRCVKTGIK
jgi:serine/threonine-protein kinase